MLSIRSYEYFAEITDIIIENSFFMAMKEIVLELMQNVDSQNFRSAMRSRLGFIGKSILFCTHFFNTPFSHGMRVKTRCYTDASGKLEIQNE